MPDIHALLVGINRYQHIRPLSGCVADIEAIKDLLESRVPRQNLHLTVLRDREASREGIIAAFRTHLGQAQAGDVALFYYCGHGSLENCPEPWQAFEPNGKNQTLVPCDARAPGIFDLADKEINALISEVAIEGVTAVAVFDSCHSGGVTRNADGEPEDPGVRMTPTAGAVRSLSDYLEAARRLYDPERVAVEGPSEPRHIAIAACQPEQTAKELPLGGGVRGVFSVAFAEAVTALGPSATYADLVTAIRAKVRDRADQQVPALYVAGGASGRELFLSGKVGRRDLTVDLEAGAWWLSAGAIDGIPAPESGVVTEVEVHERDADLETTPEPLAHGHVEETMADRARLALRAGGTALDATRQYRGVVTKLNRAALELTITSTAGDAEAADRVRAALQGNPLYTVVHRPTGSTVVSVEVGAGTIRLVGPDGRDLSSLRFRIDPTGFQALAGACVHLAQWHALRERVSASTALNGAVEVELLPLLEGETMAPVDRKPLEVANGTLNLSYTGNTPPRVQVRLRNKSSRRVYAALVDLTDSFACQPMFNDWLEPAGTGLVAGGKAQRLEVPAWKPAATDSVTDILKVVAATTHFDVERWRQEPLLGIRDRNALEEQLRGERDFTGDPEAEPADEESFWGTSKLEVVTRR